MAASSAGFHEAEEALSPTTKDMHRAIVSLMEELEAIDWYQQRIDAAGDGELKEILRHNRDEEKEHAAMVLEWIRRRDPSFDEDLRAFLFTERPITALEPAARRRANGRRGAAGGGEPTLRDRGIAERSPLMDILRRGSAQLSDAVWKELDEAAATAAKNVMTARRIATFDGPRGWDYIATPLGTMKACADAEGKAVVCVPEVALLAQIRADFSLPWSAVEAFERGGPALDTATGRGRRARGRARGGPPRVLRPARRHRVPRGPRVAAPPAGDWSDPARRHRRSRAGRRDAGPADGARPVRGGPLAGSLLRLPRRRRTAATRCPATPRPSSPRFIAPS